MPGDGGIHQREEFVVGQHAEFARSLSGCDPLSGPLESIGSSNRGI